MIESHSGFPTDLLDSQISCRHFLEISPDAVVIHSQDRILFVNDAAVRLFCAASPSDLLGLSPLELASAESRDLIESRFQKVISEHRPTSPVETTVRSRDGKSVDVELLAIPILQTSGPSAVIVVFRDRSERNRDKAETLKSEHQVRMILDTAMDGIISMDEQQNIILFNRAAESIFGWRAEEVMGKSINLLIPARYHSLHRPAVEQFGKGEIPSRRMSVQRTVMALRGSGEEFPIEASISRTTVNGQRIYTVILRDVTELVMHRHQIEQQSQMLDHVSEAVTVIDNAGGITYWNQAAHNLFGWTSHEAIGKNVDELLPQARQTRPHEPRISDDLHSRSGEFSLMTREGKTIIVDHRSTILRDENGQTRGYLFIDIDITSRKKREQLANRSQRLESIGTLASGIAHDLNNVLTPILMGAKLLSSDRAPSNRQGLLNTMVASAQRGAAMIQQLLSFAGGIRGEQSPVRIERLVEETRTLLEHTLTKSIQIQTNVAKKCPAVMGDSTELAQILMNLCVNARDAMPDGGTLTIEASPIELNGTATRLHPDAKPGPYLLLTVSDTGAGMSHEVLNRIFDPFFTTKELGKGTGLGLATVQGIVKSHGGFVTVYSELNQGSKFSIYLPSIPDTEPIKTPSQVATAAQGQGQLILLVDDEETIRKMTSAVLEQAGYGVITASDGGSALSIYRAYQSEISVVLMDLMMPGMSGLETLEQLRKEAPGIKVIVCSGLRTNQRETEVLNRGAVAFLPKPYAEQQLLQVLSQTLNQKGV